MGCICCPLGNFVSSMLYAIERISTCAACAALVFCMLITIVVACVFGVALGYHFCVVEHNAEAMDRATSGGLTADSDELDRRRSGSADVDTPLPPANDRQQYLANPDQAYLLEDSNRGPDRRRSLSQQEATGRKLNITIPKASPNKAQDLFPGRLYGGGKVQRTVLETAPARGLIFKRSIPDSPRSLFNSSLTSNLTNITLYMQN